MSTTRTRWTAALVLVAAALSPAPALAATRAGEIDSVVVFADRARVTRTGAARCARGAARALFERLPAALDTRTLRGEASDGAEVIGLTSELVDQEQLVDPRARPLRDELDKIAAELRAGEARQQTVSAETQLLNGYLGVFVATVSEEMRNPAPGTTAWTRTLEALRERRASAQQQYRKLEVAARALRLREDRLRRELGYLDAAGSARATRTAAVTLDCHGRAEVTTSISYVVPGAGWQPEYDLSFTPSRAGGKTGPGAVRLTVGALVRQSTGEDWQGVRLQLSTARPKLGAEAPQPAPLVIGGAEQRRDKVLVQAQERREQLGAGSAGGGATGASAAALDDKGSAFVLTLPHRVSIASDGRPVWAPVDLIQAAGNVKLVATPKLDERVYQIVALKNPAAYALLDGRVRSYRAGSYVGDAQLRYRGVGEPMEVSLGADEELKVERKTLDEKDKGPGLLGSTKQIVRAFRVTLSNRAAGAETVELREGLPVSKIADVAVELAAARTTSGYQLDAARGFLTWQVALKSGEQRSIDLGYVIRLPDDWQVPAMR
ncbi:MAG TPA: mucoidy inhibitor MuiA family protein [Polyangia bacterium]|nr:mucoidy inhibitor MuiA family protein [Polyangia bacterium]